MFIQSCVCLLRHSFFRIFLSSFFLLACGTHAGNDQDPELTRIIASDEGSLRVIEQETDDIRARIKSALLNAFVAYKPITDVAISFQAQQELDENAHTLGQTHCVLGTCSIVLSEDLQMRPVLRRLAMAHELLHAAGFSHSCELKDVNCHEIIDTSSGLMAPRFRDYYYTEIEESDILRRSLQADYLQHLLSR